MATWMKEGQTSVTPETPAMLLSRAHRLLEVIRYFLWLGVTGFGGPVALCGLMGAISSNDAAGSTSRKCAT